MNIFYVDVNPVVAAASLVDKHVVKMVLETAQLLSTAHRVLDGEPYTDLSGKRKMIRYRLNPPRDVLYTATHVQYPCSVWVRNSAANYDWLSLHFAALLDEYTYRYKKTHKCASFSHLLWGKPTAIPVKPFTEPPQCMPVECMVENDTVAAYRNCYNNAKRHLHRYTKRQPPTWLKPSVVE